MTKENKRVSPSYKNTSDEYVIERDEIQLSSCGKQFFIVYQTRMHQLEDRVIKQSIKVLGKKHEFVEMDKMSATESSLVFGFTVKRMTKPPSVFNEFGNELGRREEDLDEGKEEKTPFWMVKSICSEEDILLLEDTKQRIGLSGNIDKNDHVSGVVVAIFGRKNNEDHTIVVDKIIYPELAPQIPRMIPEEDIYVMFLSGLDFDMDMSKNEGVCLALAQLIDWIHGCNSDEDMELARRVARIVLAGDSVCLSSRIISKTKITAIGQVKPRLEPTPIEQVDRVLEDIASAVPVDVMSGPNDPCDIMFPQQPIVVRVFDKCYRFGKEMFQTVTNPYSFELGGTRILGTSGQNIDDVRKFTRGYSTLDLMQQLLERSHLAPTWPSTLDGYPVVGRDPATVEELPHVFFAGNQPSHETKFCEFENGARTLLMTIPRFSHDCSAVLLNIRTLETQIFRFESAICT